MSLTKEKLVQLGLLSNQNTLINGDFQQWQDGTSFTAKGYTADQWYAYFYDGQTIARISNTSPAPTRYALRMYRTSSEGYLLLSQPLENNDIMSGITYTLSFWAKGYGGYTGLLTVIIGGTYYTVTLTSAWTRYEIQATSYVSGSTLSTRGVSFQRSVLAGQGFEIAAAKLEPKSISTPFEQEDSQLSLMRAQYFYNRIDVGNVFPWLYEGLSVRRYAFTYPMMRLAATPDVTSLSEYRVWTAIPSLSRVTYDTTNSRFRLTVTSADIAQANNVYLTGTIKIDARIY